MQLCTQRYGKRPYGVGLLVAGYDDKGPHIFQTCPSANYYGNFSLKILCILLGISRGEFLSSVQTLPKLTNWPLRSLHTGSLVITLTVTQFERVSLTFCIILC